MTLFVPGRDLAWRLGRERSPWMTNLPPDAEIVGCRMDAERNGLVLTIRSAAFARIVEGAAIPVLEPAFNGLRWKRH